MKKQEYTNMYKQIEIYISCSMNKYYVERIQK